MALCHAFQCVTNSIYTLPGMLGVVRMQCSWRVYAHLHRPHATAELHWPGAMAAPDTAQDCLLTESYKFTKHWTEKGYHKDLEHAPDCSSSCW